MFLQHTQRSSPLSSAIVSFSGREKKDSFSGHTSLKTRETAMAHSRIEKEHRWQINGVRK